MRLSRSLIGDIALALVLTVVGLGGTTSANAFMSPDRPIDAVGFGLVIATALVLSVRRRWPLVTLAVATLCSSTYLVLGYTYGPILFSFFVAVYTVARHVPLARAWPPCALALVILLAHIFTNSASLPGLLGVIPGSAWVVVPFAIGVTVRLTREAAAQARAETVRQHVDEERLRVAQEVHDVVGHGLAAIKMQADVALHVLPKRPEQAEVALNAISRTSTAALDELRATLAVVRRTGADPERTPAPGLERLDELRQRMSDAGVDIHLETDGERRALPAAVELAGYRVVQESLTNVLRHGAAKVASVRIGYQTDAVTLAISNPAGAVRSRGGGLGIPGMRERVEALGGEFTAGPTDDGQFMVRASIPTGGAA
ncbi:histidine kinase [Actinopolymorpha sp. B17G11]|uniref:sensor histidine kinase n=1 Tax=Actinopolymorpha sp. B17G11 TaxID=3160861 RepID=UPI0032E40ED8